MSRQKNMNFSQSDLPGYPTDIADRILQEFSEEIPRVRVLLESLHSDRLIRCALFLARGSFPRLETTVKLGLADYRDLIMSAEYDRFQIQLRDFNRPFGSEEVPNPLERNWTPRYDKPA
jgi:hypothetical protein